LAKLIYSAITSLDGYTADEDGNFDWAAPDEEVHTVVNDLERPVGTYLYGRRRTRIERDFDPEAVRQLKTQAERDISVGGPDLAAQAIKAGLVDEFHLFFVPIVVGGGNQALPDHVRLKLELLDERRFGNGAVHLRYATRT
jgi:riboflavin biosynthesis pyrimidine reductase